MAQAQVRRQRRRGDWGSHGQAPTERSGRRPGEPAWDAAVEAFLRDARARNCSPATLANYRAYLLGPRAQQFLVDYGVRSVADVTPDALRDFQDDLLEAGVAPSTAGTFHRIVRNFLGYCQREGWAVAESALRTAPPIEPQVEPETFTEDEERRLIGAARTERDRFLIEFMMRTGLRVSEVASVTVDDIIDQGDGAFLRVRQGKGRKDRIVPLDTGGVRFSKKVQAYVRRVRPTDSTDRHLFLGHRHDKKTAAYRRLDVTAIKSLFQRLEEATGIHTFPHKFRHTFATRALRSGVDSLVLQRALGHTTLAMVNRYVHYNASDMLEAWRRRPD